MLSIIRLLFSAGPTLRERERAYLAAAVSRYDLERREREIDSGLFRHA